MKRRAATLVFVFGTAAVAAGYLWLKGDASTTDDVAQVSREDFRVVVDATGKLEAALAYEIGPPSVRDVWNYNLKWMVPEGKRVNEGEPIARFDATELDERLRDYNAQLKTIIQEREKEERNLEVSLKQLRLDLVKSEGELKRADVELSVPEGLVGAIQLGKLRLARDLAKRRVEFLNEKITFEQELVQAKLELLDVKKKRSEQLIAYTEGAKAKFTVRAPIDGLVLYVPKNNGDRWEVGERVWMLAKLIKVADVSTLRVEAQVLEVDAARIAVGQAASVGIDAIPGVTIRTEIAEIGRLVRERSVQDSSKVFDAFMPVEKVDPELMRPGMSIHAELEVAVLLDRLTIPVAAVRLSEAGPYVEVLEADGTSQRRSVELGPRDSERVVVERGLDEGEVVILGVEAA